MHGVSARMEYAMTTGANCVYCGQPDNEMHKDHLIPQSRGGSDEPENCVLACSRCNISKSDMTPGEWKPNGLPVSVYERERKLAKKYRMKSRKERGRQPTKVHRPTDPLIGKFFHTWKDGKISMQGVIDDVVALEPKRYLVTTFSWLTGADYKTEIVGADEMSQWTFYPTAEEMQDFYRYDYAARELAR